MDLDRTPRIWNPWIRIRTLDQSQILLIRDRTLGPALEPIAVKKLNLNHWIWIGTHGSESEPLNLDQNSSKRVETFGPDPKQTPKYLKIVLNWIHMKYLKELVNRR